MAHLMSGTKGTNRDKCPGQYRDKSGHPPFRGVSLVPLSLSVAERESHLG